MKAAMLLIMDMLNDLVHENGGGAKTYVPLTKERNAVWLASPPDYTLEISARMTRPMNPA